MSFSICLGNTLKDQHLKRPSSPTLRIYGGMCSIFLLNKSTFLKSFSLLEGFDVEVIPDMHANPKRNKSDHLNNKNNKNNKQKEEYL